MGIYLKFELDISPLKHSIVISHQWQREGLGRPGSEEMLARLKVYLSPPSQQVWAKPGR